MKKNSTVKICLGSAQFGLNYGIVNKAGKIPAGEVFKILDYAYQKGINTLDTAFAYGESEEVIGEFIKTRGVNFNIISKLPPWSDCQSKIEDIFKKSLERLNQDKLYGYLIHSFEDFLNHREIIDELENLKEKDLVKKIGFSLYSPSELKILIDQRVIFDIIQVPYSIFDRRFESYFRILQEKKIEVHVRSVFLQGLAFIPPEKLPLHLVGARDSLEKLRQLTQEFHISPDALCINFALLNSDVDKVVIGIDSLDHIKTNIEDLKLATKMDLFKDKLAELVIHDENILLPFKWKNI